MTEGSPKPPALPRSRGRRVGPPTPQPETSPHGQSVLAIQNEYKAKLDRLNTSPTVELAGEVYDSLIHDAVSLDDFMTVFALGFNLSRGREDENRVEAGKEIIRRVEEDLQQPVFCKGLPAKRIAATGESKRTIKKWMTDALPDLRTSPSISPEIIRFCEQCGAYATTDAQYFFYLPENPQDEAQVQTLDNLNSIIQLAWATAQQIKPEADDYTIATTPANVIQLISDTGEVSRAPNLMDYRIVNKRYGNLTFGQLFQPNVLQSQKAAILRGVFDGDQVMSAAGAATMLQTQTEFTLLLRARLTGQHMQQYLNAIDFQEWLAGEVLFGVGGGDALDDTMIAEWGAKQTFPGEMLGRVLFHAAVRSNANRAVLTRTRMPSSIARMLDQPDGELTPVQIGERILQQLPTMQAQWLARFGDTVRLREMYTTFESEARSFVAQNSNSSEASRNEVQQKVAKWQDFMLTQANGSIIESYRVMLQEFANNPTEHGADALMFALLNDSTGVEDLVSVVSTAYGLWRKPEPQRSIGQRMLNQLNQYVQTQSISKLSREENTSSISEFKRERGKYLETLLRQTGRNAIPGEAARLVQELHVWTQNDDRFFHYFADPAVSWTATHPLLNEIGAIGARAFMRDETTSYEDRFEYPAQLMRDLVQLDQAHNGIPVLTRDIGGYSYGRLVQIIQQQGIHSEECKLYAFGLMTKSFYGDYVLQNLAAGMFLHPQFPLPDGINPSDVPAEGYALGVFFQDWLAGQLLFPEADDHDEHIEQLIMGWSQYQVFPGKLIGRTIFRAALFSHLNAGQFGYPNHANSVARSLLGDANSHSSPEQRGEALAARASDIAHEWPNRFHALSPIFEMQEGFLAEVEAFRIRLPPYDQLSNHNRLNSPVVSDEEESPAQAPIPPTRAEQRIAQIAANAIVPDGAYYVSDIPPEFAQMSIRREETRSYEANGNENGNGNEINRLERTITYEKGRAFQAMANMLLGYVYPDCVVCPELALHTGIAEDGEDLRAYATTRVDAAVLQVNPDTGKVVRVVAVAEDKWGMAVDNIAQSLAREAAFLTKPPFEGCRRFLFRNTGDATAADIPVTGSVQVVAVAPQDIHPHFWSHSGDEIAEQYGGVSPIEQIKFEDVTSSLGDGVGIVLEDIAILQLIYERMDHEIAQAEPDRKKTMLEQRLEVYKSMKHYFFQLMEEANAILRDNTIPVDDRPSRKAQYIQQQLTRLTGLIHHSETALLEAELQRKPRNGNPDTLLNFIVGDTIFRSRLQFAKAATTGHVVPLAENERTPRHRRELLMPEAITVTPEMAGFLASSVNHEGKLITLALLAENPGVTVRQFQRIISQYPQSATVTAQLRETLQFMEKFGIVQLNRETIQLTGKGTVFAATAGHLLAEISKDQYAQPLVSIFGFVNVTDVTKETAHQYNLRPVRTFQLLSLVSEYNSVREPGSPGGLPEQTIYNQLHIYPDTDIHRTIEDLIKTRVLRRAHDGQITFANSIVETIVLELLIANGASAAQREDESYIASGNNTGRNCLADTDKIGQLFFRAYKASPYTGKK